MRTMLESLWRVQQQQQQHMHASYVLLCMYVMKLLDAYAADQLHCG